MSERVIATAKEPKTKGENMASRVQQPVFFRSISSPVDQILFLQRTIGNRAVLKLLKSSVIQAKLKIGQPGDKYEQEADRMADAVMSMSMPQVHRQSEEEENKEEELQSKELHGQTPEVTTNLEARLNAIRGDGQPLHPSTRAFFESRFGYDFGQVRVHTDAEADKLSSSLNARAFTTGQDTFFSQGTYNPGSKDGHELLTHELTHVVQQRGYKYGPVTSNIHNQINGLRGSGQPLSQSVRSFFEPQFGYDFSRIRIYTNDRASETARALNSHAYTIGRDIVFGTDQYAPDTGTGKRLLAHELTHTIQKNDGVSPLRLTQSVGDSTDMMQRQTGLVGNNEMTTSDPNIQLAVTDLLIQRDCPPPERLGNTPAPEPCVDADPNTAAPDHFSIPLRFCFDSDNLIDSDAGNISALRSRLQILMLARRSVHIHGYASTPGGSRYNIRLACHRAAAVKRMLALRTSNPIVLYSHGATSIFGSQDENQRVIVSVDPAPTPTPPPQSPPPAPSIPVVSCPSCPSANPTCPPAYCMAMSHAEAIADRFLKAQPLIAVLTALGGIEVGAIFSQYVWGGRTGVMTLSSTLRNEFATICQTAVATNHIMTAIINAIWGRYPASTPAQTIPLNSIASTAVRDIGTPHNAHELVYCGARNAPGLMAGGIGTNQLTTPVGANPSTQNDSRTATGHIDVSRHSLPGGTRLVFTPTVNIEVRDTVDFCPGNCGDWAARRATVPFSRWEASGISGDVAFVTQFAAPRSQLRKIVLQTVSGVDRWSLESM